VVTFIFGERGVEKKVGFFPGWEKGSGPLTRMFPGPGRKREKETWGLRGRSLLIVNRTIHPTKSPAKFW